MNTQERYLTAYEQPERHKRSDIPLLCVLWGMTGFIAGVSALAIFITAI